MTMAPAFRWPTMHAFSFHLRVWKAAARARQCWRHGAWISHCTTHCRMARWARDDFNFRSGRCAHHDRMARRLKGDLRDNHRLADDFSCGNIVQRLRHIGQRYLCPDAWLKFAFRQPAHQLNEPFTGLWFRCNKFPQNTPTMDALQRAAGSSATQGMVPSIKPMTK